MSKTIMVEISIRTFHTSDDGFDITPSAVILIPRERLDVGATPIDFGAVCDQLDGVVADIPDELGHDVRPQTPEEVKEYRASEAEDERDPSLVTITL